MEKPKLMIASKNYGSWSLRGWLLCKMAGLDFDEQVAAADDPSTRAELLLLSPSFLVPSLTNGSVKVWDAVKGKERRTLRTQPALESAPAFSAALSVWMA